MDVWMRDRHPSFLPTNDKDYYNTAQANIHITTTRQNHFDVMGLFSATQYATKLELVYSIMQRTKLQTAFFEVH
jgi:hypothetical protein